MASTYAAAGESVAVWTSVIRVRIDVLTKEYPPTIYGGAGVHVTELVRALRALDIETQVLSLIHI